MNTYKISGIVVLKQSKAIPRVSYFARLTDEPNDHFCIIQKDDGQGICSGLMSKSGKHSRFTSQWNNIVSLKPWLKVKVSSKEARLVEIAYSSYGYISPMQYRDGIISIFKTRCEPGDIVKYTTNGLHYSKATIESYEPDKKAFILLNEENVKIRANRCQFVLVDKVDTRELVEIVCSSCGRHKTHPQEMKTVHNHFEQYEKDGCKLQG